MVSTCHHIQEATLASHIANAGGVGSHLLVEIAKDEYFVVVCRILFDGLEKVPPECCAWIARRVFGEE